MIFFFNVYVSNTWKYYSTFGLIRTYFDPDWRQYVATTWQDAFNKLLNLRQGGNLSIPKLHINLVCTYNFNPIVFSFPYLRWQETVRSFIRIDKFRGKTVWSCKRLKTLKKLIDTLHAAAHTSTWNVPSFHWLSGRLRKLYKLFVWF